MSLRLMLPIVVGKLVSFVSRVSGRGAGATWPGEIALRMKPTLLRSFASQNIQIILVAGTNGKTTTVKMTETILTNAGEHVHRNTSGANLDNGIASSFIQDARLTGTLKSRYFIFEVDEATLPILLSHFTPSVLVLNNLFRDQLDRYGEVDTIAEKWQTALARLTHTTVIANSDDPHITFIAKQLHTPVKFFGLEDRSLFLPKMQHATDTIYCPNCGHRLTFAGVYFSHLGKWACGHCSFVPPTEDITARDFESPVEGVYNKYNTLAAALTARTLGFSDAAIRAGLAAFTPAFGRMETIKQDGKQIKILLSKNPTGLNESLRTVAASLEKGPMLLVLNDRIPDGTDVSWIWDVDFEQMSSTSQHSFVSGDRVYDLAVRLKYAGLAVNSESGIMKTGKPMVSVKPTLQEAIDGALAETNEGETLWILPTYSAMLDVRKILTGRKIL